ncbi:hypothetical protein F0L17_08195 [Streptomyces sp. TRM43335]|uniref:Uncharacterized protein n=1 Tax=Streptomyces taklimakanensis TaxID=2569853 RepID=A0A6G2BA20_9ACTN|nr:hypothetical protein [Streptomyces taklimakanensis]MTE19108.1 hypothetical protein [Streptomyces taklimakanensis]
MRDVREKQPRALAYLWMDANPDHPEAKMDYSVRDEISAAAYDGNNRAKGLAGQQ